MAKAGENIYRRKDGRYEGRHVIGKTAGGRTRFGYIYGRQYGEVKRALILKKAKREKTGGSTKVLRETVSVWARRMLDDLSGRIKLSSMQTYWNLLDRRQLPAIGYMKITAVTDGNVREQRVLSPAEQQNPAPSRDASTSLCTVWVSRAPRSTLSPTGAFLPSQTD